MHSAVLDATGYTLLLSSFITLVILLWKGCKRKKKLSFYVLSASDVFSAILTAIILLVNHIDDGIRLSYNWQNNTNGDIFNAWTMGEDYRFPFLQTHPREAVNEIDLNVTLTCGMQDLLMQYGMLIAGLTNAFISLLTFTVQCNLNAVCAKRRCADVMRSLKNTHLEPKNVEVKCQDGEMSRRKNEQESASQQADDINVKNRSNIIQRSMKISNFRTLKEDDKRPTNFLVMSHWLVPFLVVGMLYFAEYNDMNDTRDAEDIECIFGSNFPMNDFDTFSVTDDNLNITGSVTYMTSEHNYFFNEMPSNRSKPSSAEIDEVVSKVQNIVRTALRYASNSTMKITNFHNTPRLQNLTQYILIHNLMKYIKNITNVNGVRGLNSTLIERDISIHNSSTNNSIHLNQDSEVSLLYDVSKNASEESDVTTSESLSNVSQVSIKNKDDSHQEDAQIYFASTEESTTQTTTDTSIVQNTTFVSNNQIYDEIMKRIQAASAYSAKNHYNHYNHLINRPKDGDQPKISNLNNYMEKRKPNSIKDLFSKNDNRYINTRTEQNNSLHMTNECLVSTKFLKLQLFVLSFTMYFLPILLSCILQMRGKHTCKNILAMLRAKTDLTSKDDKKIRRQDSVEGPSMPQGSRNHSWTDIDAIEKDHESCKENESMALEIDCMIRIFDTITLSLILCIVFWTPVFLGTLLRVYSCIRAPQWLNDITFLSAVSFGIVRNALNINIIRIQEACSDNMKENRIHPVE
ncbi:hypothetical protein ALC57_05281 [Trachymyrmex cornetzi]|uniref:Uncharacterized protein n=1 Tax=Trachymyrmex cornetzi TaxID=471704 RepID=A0A151JB44_9HYME|nr:hypothetical protein ALC57_05281 [Trachymyrmex cornetzi]